MKKDSSLTVLPFEELLIEDVIRVAITSMLSKANECDHLVQMEDFGSHAGAYC